MVVQRTHTGAGASWFSRRLALALLGMLSAPAAWAEISISADIFVGGEEGSLGTSNYRIPSMVIAPDGSLLAFAEARRNNSDPGAAGAPIDMVVKRSNDQGRTWRDYTVLHANSQFDYSDPRPIVDTNTGRVVLTYQQWPDACGQGCVPAGLDSTSSVTFVQTSSDNGVSWSGPININSQVKDPAWRALNVGPGIGIQLQWQRDAQRNGRLILPGHRRNAAGDYHPLTLFSDDGGATWQAGSPVPGPESNESELVELANGDLLMDSRQEAGSLRRRFISTDGGVTWSSNIPGDITITPVDTGMLRYSAVRAGDDRDRILYSGPLGDPAGAGNNRTNIGLWTSYDEGQTFINPIQMAEGHAAYSVLDRLQDGRVGLVYEAAGSTLIRYLAFDVAHLEGSGHVASTTHYDGFGNSIDAWRGGLGWSGAWSRSSGVDLRADGGLEYDSFRLDGETQRAHLRDGSLARQLGRSLDLDANQDYYVSLFLRSDSDASDLASGESLSVRLLEGEFQRFGFGVDDDEAFFVENQNSGSRVRSANDGAARDTSLFVLAKLEAADGPAGTAWDTISLSFFDSPLSVPNDESSIEWNVVGATGANYSGVIDGISIVGGPSADWNVDALRVAAAFEGAVFRNGLNGVEGDLNQNGSLDPSDIDAFVAGWRTTGHQTLVEMYAAGDLNFDGTTNWPDAFLFHEILVRNGSEFPFGRLVPEPSTGCLSMGAWLLMLLRRYGRIAS